MKTVILFILISFISYPQTIIDFSDSTALLSLVIHGDPQQATVGDSATFVGFIDSVRTNLTYDWMIAMGDMTDSITSVWQMQIDKLQDRSMINTYLSLPGNHDVYYSGDKTTFKEGFLDSLPAVSDVEVFNVSGDEVCRYVKNLGEDIYAIFFDIVKDTINSGGGSPSLFFNPDTTWLGNKADSIAGLGGYFFIVTHPQLFYAKYPGILGEGITDITPLITCLNAHPNFMKLFINGHAHRYALEIDPQGWLHINADSYRRGTGLDLVVPYVEIYSEYLRVYQYIYKGTRNTYYNNSPVPFYKNIWKYTFLDDSWVLKWR